jgi:hypothetical protein
VRLTSDILRGPEWKRDKIYSACTKGQNQGIGEVTGRQTFLMNYLNKKKKPELFVTAK